MAEHRIEYDCKEIFNTLLAHAGFKKLYIYQPSAILDACRYLENRPNASMNEVIDAQDSDYGHSGYSASQTYAFAKDIVEHQGDNIRMALEKGHTHPLVS